jgi:molybdopterin-guanine dinucleotide biosynthesis protein A
MTARADVGMLLLTGGQGRRLGGSKHDRPHPRGGTWGGHLVRIFQANFPTGPVEILGEGLPDRPDLAPVSDPRQGPAAALRAWAALGRGELAQRWWVVACDCPGWREADLRAWWGRVREVDPEGTAWVVAEVEGRLQPLGGMLPAALLPALAAQGTPRLGELWGALPGRRVPASGACWTDVDDPEALARFLRTPV